MYSKVGQDRATYSLNEHGTPARHGCAAAAGQPPRVVVRAHLEVPFCQKERAKALGARWDPEHKKWFVEQGQNLADFSEWLPSSLMLSRGSPAVSTASTHDVPKHPPAQDRLARTPEKPLGAAGNRTIRALSPHKADRKRERVASRESGAELEKTSATHGRRSPRKEQSVAKRRITALSPHKADQKRERVASRESGAELEKTSATHGRKSPSKEQKSRINALRDIDGDDDASMKGFWMYRRKYRDEIRKSLPEGKRMKSDVSRVAGERWRAMTLDEKRSFIMTSKLTEEAGVASGADAVGAQDFGDLGQQQSVAKSRINALRDIDGDKKASLKGYRAYMQKYRDEIWKSLPEGSRPCDFCRVAGERWRAMTPDEKRSFIMTSKLPEEAGVASGADAVDAQDSGDLGQQFKGVEYSDEDEAPLITLGQQQMRA